MMIFDFQRIYPIFPFYKLLGKGYKDHFQLHECDVDNILLTTIQHKGKNLEILISGDLQGNVNILDLDSFKKIFSEKMHGGSVKEIKSLSENRLLSSSKDGNVKIWEIGCRRTINEEL